MTKGTKQFIIFILIVAVSIYALKAVYGFLTAPKYHTTTAATIDPSGDPVQIDLKNAESIPISFESGNADLQPMAAYKISAKVCGRKKYRQKWDCLVAPYDLCLMWGRLATESIKGKVKFTQDMRWYQFWGNRDSGFEGGYVATHSANTHVITMDKNLRKAIKRLEKGDVVEMSGYLISLKGKYQGQEILWKSSLSRDDTGRGACEVFYLSSLRLGNRLYGTPVTEFAE